MRSIQNGLHPPVKKASNFSAPLLACHSNYCLSIPLPHNSPNPVHVSVPVMQLRGNSIWFISKSSSKNGPSKLKRPLNMSKVRQNSYSGRLFSISKKTSCQVTHFACSVNGKKWIYNEVTKRMMLHNLPFITLTVSDPPHFTASQAFKILLNPWLQWLRGTVIVIHVWKHNYRKMDKYIIMLLHLHSFHGKRFVTNGITYKESGLLDIY